MITALIYITNMQAFLDYIKPQLESLIRKPSKEHQGKKTLKGIYILMIEIDKNVSIKIGALGKLTFSKGLYAYVGSAQNNLELRVKRHRSKEKRLFWHIDYLLENPAAKTVNVLYKESDKTEECKIASLLQQNAEPIPGFGSSDCTCKSHLFKSSQFNFLQEYMRSLKLDKIDKNR